MKVLCFGVAKEIVGTSELVLDKDEALTVAELKEHLNTAYPQFLEYKSYMVAINQAYAADDAIVSPSDEIAIIPPVSGG